MNHFVPSVGPFQYPHGCRIQGSGYGLRESRDARRQIFHQQRSWLLTSHMIRALSDVWDNATYAALHLIWTFWHGRWRTVDDVPTRPLGRRRRHFAGGGVKGLQVERH
jgi:hypothetical protein